MKLAHHIAIVTGASSGIGQAIAVAFAREGAAVAIAFHGHEAHAEETRKAVEAEGGRSIVFGLDVGAEKDVEALFAKTTAELGTPTLLVNSAGVDASGIKVRDMSLDTWETTLRTNLTGPFLTSRAFLKGLAGKPGKIINISSVHQDIARSGAAEYCASKGGIRMLTRTLALESAADGVTVNAIAPGMVLTPMNQEAIDDPKVLAEQVESIPLKRAAQPQEIAELAVYLASKAADYATGSTFTLDGGLEINLGQGA
jgi:glucose 1-dehydrogenase